MNVVHNINDGGSVIGKGTFVKAKETLLAAA